MERPALENLLCDIKQNNIDIIVVYKVDRLSRSLGDFAKLMDIFEQHQVSFVSVTQQFNTTSSMGRLTLNMLLSFAQFEREITGERIRDKIAASKAKGLWMGGHIPLGYDPHPAPHMRRLIVNHKEAKTVLEIFNLYDDLSCLARVEKSAKEKNLLSKSGKLFSRGAIHKLLTNPLYIGKIRHKNNIYDGQHQAVISDVLWQTVQEKLQSASTKKRGQSNQAHHHAWLTGKVFDDAKDLLTPTHTKKGNRIFRYYISKRLVVGRADKSGWRLPAKQLEDTIQHLILEHVGSIKEKMIDKTELHLYEANQTTFAKRIQELQFDKVRLQQLIDTIQLKKGEVTLRLSAHQYVNFFAISTDEFEERDLTFTAPFTIKRRGNEAKIITGEYHTQTDIRLQQILARAHQWLGMIKQGLSIADIARSERLSESYIRLRLPLATLSPKIQKAIIQGTQPVEFSIQHLIKSKTPLIWNDQEQYFGFKQ